MYEKAIDAIDIMDRNDQVGSLACREIYLVGGLQVHVVESRISQQDQLHAQLRQLSYHLIDIIITLPKHCTAREWYFGLDRIMSLKNVFSYSLCTTRFEFNFLFSTRATQATRMRRGHFFLISHRGGTGVIDEEAHSVVSAKNNIHSVNF